MKLIKQSCEILSYPSFALRLIEQAGRTCYKSEAKITETSAEKFISSLIEKDHLSVIEHVSVTVKFVTNRGVTHELVRHRLCSFSQESTRYCNYGGDDISFIVPTWITSAPEIGYDEAFAVFEIACENAETYYKTLLQKGWSPQQAREVLPNALKTEIVMTANLREWKHIFKLRTSKAAHPQMRELMLDCLNKFQRCFPIVFDGIREDSNA